MVEKQRIRLYSARPQMPEHISLSLISHTNVGKTTLARTLLGRDVGEVRDAPHVTEFASVYTLLETPDGDTLQLWDTPGFGDSVRLAARMRQSANPVGWFLSAVWDRFRDRAFWSSQQALRNVRQEADVVLYLVNASETPEAAGYVPPEMELLAWIGRPVIVLLNQLGAPRAADEEAADVARWRDSLAGHRNVVAVLPLDAFARCWVQEFTLLQAVEAALPAERRALMARLAQAWQARRLATFGQAVDGMARSLARLACARQLVDGPGGWRGKLKQVGAAIGSGMGLGSAEPSPVERAQQALGEQLAAELQRHTDELIVLHGLQGEAGREVLERVATQYELRLRLDESKAALWGGMLTGALAGLKADIATGGLTLGGGLLAGGLIGALGGAGIARCVNLVRGSDQSWIAWNADALNQLFEAALLRYLAVAHFGRGRGDWAISEAPPHWREVVAQAMAAQLPTLATIWDQRGEPGAAADNAGTSLQISSALRPVIGHALQTVLERLYPDALATHSPPRAPPASPPRRARP